MILLAFLLCLMVLAAWAVSVRLRFYRNRFSTLEAFILGHIPFFVIGLAGCSWSISQASPEEVWVYAFYVPLTLAGVLIGGAAVRGAAPAGTAPDRLEVSPRTGDLTPTLTACLLLTVIGAYALTLHPIPLLERLRMPRAERFVSSLDYLPLAHLNQLLIVPAVMLFVCFFVTRSRARRALPLVFVISLGAFGLAALVSLSRGRLYQFGFSLLLIAWYLGSARTRRMVVVLALVGVLLLAPFGAALATYRDTLDVHEAIDTVVSGEWLMRWREDESNSCADVGLACLSAYEHPQNRRGLDGVSPIVFFFVPRLVWAEKPMVFGQVVWRDVMDGWSEVLGVGPTFIAEAYSVAGWLGVLVWSVVLGALFVLFERLCYKHLRPWESLGLVVVSLVPAVTVVRGDFHSAFVARFVEYPLFYFTLSFVARGLGRLLSPGLASAGHAASARAGPSAGEGGE